MSRKRHTVADEPFFLVRTLAAEYPGGSKLDAHKHNWGQLIFAQAGVMQVWAASAHRSAAGGSWIVPPHWAIWAPANVRHSMRFSSRTSLRTLYIRPGLQELPEQCTVVRVSPLLRELILRSVEIGMLDQREPLHAAMTKLILAELHAYPAPPFDLRMPSQPALRRVAESIEGTPQARVSNAELAKRFDIGLRTLERGFVAETGIPLGRWRMQARFLLALRLLGEGLAVKQAALDAGYRSASAFIAAFRAVFQVSPGKYFAAIQQNRTAS